jgi:peptidoglycan/LPS O-acetylase OafA/YrhL
MSGSSSVASDVVSRPGYRSDIDGLRAVAVFSVVAYHAFPQLAPGGFVGVDVFFVISGFLISSLILGGLRAGDFSFSDFYARRIRRIFPALIVVMLACWMLGWFLLLPNEYRQLSRHIVAGAAFVSNFVLWGESGYFDQAAALKPLLHLWSLGIEEQFYIVWPLALYLVWKRRVSLLPATVALLLASFLAGAHLAGTDPVAAFYSPWARFWELLAGVLLAHAGRATRHDTSLLGAALVGFAVLWFDEGAWSPWWALFPVLGTYLVVSAGPGGFLNRTVLSHRWLVLGGLISYPLYLWHWPLLAFARIVHGDTPPASVRIAIVAASVVLAYATYRFLERPVRFHLSARQTVPALSLAMLVAGSVGIASVAMNGLPSRVNDAVRPYAAYEYDFGADSRMGSCWLRAADAPNAYATSCVDAPAAGKPLTMVWGDSYAARFFPGVRALTNGEVRLAQLTRSLCPPVLEYGADACAKANGFIAGEIRTLRPQTVILFADWSQYRKSDGSDLVFRQLAATVRRLKESGAPRIVVVGPAPQWRDSLPNNLVRQAVYRGSQAVETRTYYRFNTVVRGVDSALRQQLAASSGAIYFSALEAMCDATGCLTTINGRADGLTSWDDGHLTTPGALYLARKLAESVGGLE